MRNLEIVMDIGDFEQSDINFTLGKKNKTRKENWAKKKQTKYKQMRFTHFRSMYPDPGMEHEKDTFYETFRFISFLEKRKIHSDVTQFRCVSIRAEQSLNLSSSACLHLQYWELEPRKST